MKASSSILLLTPIVVKAVAGANVQSSSVASFNGTLSTTTFDGNFTVITTPTHGGGTSTVSSFGGAFPTTYPACITFVNGSAVAVPINGSTAYPSSIFPTGTALINSTAAYPAPTGSSDFNSTIIASSQAGSPTNISFGILTTAGPSVPSARAFARRQNTSPSAVVNISSTASPSFGNATRTVSIVSPSNFGGSNASATLSTAVVTYPTTYSGAYPSALPLCADLAGNASSTLASNNSLPGPTSNASAANNASNQQVDGHSGASRLGMGLYAALLGASTALAALLM